MARCRRRRANGERGASLVELAIVLPLLAVLVFGVIDLGRAWQLQNRLSNASREGAAAIQFAPRNVDPGCAGGNNATDRAEQEEPALTATPGYAVTVAQVVGSVDTPYVGCGTASTALSLAPGQQVKVTAEARFDLVTPLVGAIVGDSITVRRSTEVVVQG